MSRKLATATVLLLLLVMVGAPTGANAASKDQAYSDLSSLPKIEAYLNSIGIDLGSVVIQQGQFNYAGPNCPGAGWNCTTANKVVQLAPAVLPAANIVDCSPAVSVTFLGLDECVIVQSSVSSLVEADNDALCDFQSASGDAKQKCRVKQSSKNGNNRMEVRMRITQRGESPQTAEQEATIDQVSGTGYNTAKIMQTIQQTLDTTQTAAVTQSQNARQAATVSQMSTSGKNSSDVQQNHFQDEAAKSDGSVMQEQNTDPSFGRNLEADVTQTSTTGDIMSNLRQVIRQNQNADSQAGCTVMCSQAQGNPSGGLDGKVTQSTDDPGVLRSTSTQDERQIQDATTAGTLMQTQEGPEFCCSTQNGGTPANVDTVSQSNIQHSDPGGEQSTLQEGTCSTTGGGDCTVSQTYTSNSGTTQQSLSGPAVFCARGGESSGSCFGGD